MPYRQTAILSDVDAAYLGGLIDGEGTIALTRLHRGQNRQLVVSISSTERVAFERRFTLISVRRAKSDIGTCVREADLPFGSWVPAE